MGDPSSSEYLIDRIVAVFPEFESYWAASALSQYPE